MLVVGFFVIAFFLKDRTMLNKALKGIRQYHRLNQTELAKKLNVTRATISDIESEKVRRPISYKVLEKYSKAFDVSICEILFLEEMMKRGEAKIEIPIVIAQIYEWTTGEKFRLRLKQDAWKRIKVTFV